MTEEEKKMKSEIISMSLSKALLEKVDALQEKRNYSSRSEVIRHCLQSYITEVEQTFPDDNVSIFVVGLSYYSAKTKPVDIQELIKDFKPNISLVSRMAVSESISMIVYVLKTNLNLANIFYEKLSAIKGLIAKNIFSLRATI
ncbi:MAG: CopG family ribbon-helix-helix protein [Candidatus Hodarchaeota archaeon]